MVKKVRSVEEIVEPPDSGWAWVVLAGCFTVHMLGVGFLASVSVYVFVWVDYFDGSAAETSLVISLCSFMSGALSPVAGAVCARTGPRATVMIGGALMSIGMLVSSYSTSVLFLIISLGIVTALGMSLATIGNFAGLAIYFKKRLALAMGLATAGTSVGQLIFPPFYQYLIDQYSWRGSLMIVAGLTFNALVAGSLIRPLRSQKTKSPEKGSKKHGVEPVGKAGEGKGATRGLFETNAHSLAVFNLTALGVDRSVPSTSETALGVGSIFEGPGDVLVDEDEDEDMIQYMDSDTLSWRSEYDGELTIPNNSIWTPFSPTTFESLQVPADRRRASFVPQRPRVASMISQTLVKQSSDLPRLLRNPTFLCLLPVAMLHGFGWAATTYHLVSRAESVNIPADDAALLLTFMGASSLVGRIISGWSLDKGYIRPEIGYSLTFSICAGSTFVTPLATAFGPLTAVAVVHGLFTGMATVIVMTSPRLFFKASLATSAQAYVLLSWGVGEISGGALAGWYYDALDSYDYSYYTAGACMTTGSALMALIYFIRTSKRRKHGHAAHSTHHRDEPLESGHHRLDPELPGPNGEDLGKINPMYFMSERFDQSEVDLYQNEGIDFREDGDYGSELDVGNARDESLSEAGHTPVEQWVKGHLEANGEDPLEFGSQIYGNSPVDSSSYEDYTVRADPSASVGVAEEFTDPLREGMTEENSSVVEETVASEGNDLGEEQGMAFENPDCYYTSHEAASAAQPTNSENLYGIENPVYFARSDGPEYLMNNLESVGDGECDDEVSVLHSDEEDEFAGENESETSSVGGFVGLLKIIHHAVANQTPWRHRHESATDQSGDSPDFGINTGSKTSEDWDNVDEALDEHSEGVTNFAYEDGTGNQLDHIVEESDL